MTGTRPTFRIGVPTYRRPGDLANLLAALAPQLRSFPNVALVVVNDAGHEPGYDELADRYGDVMDYRVAEENRGPGPARDAAFAGATEDYLVGLDDDCLPGPLWLEWLHALVAAHPDVDLFAGTVEPVWTAPPRRWQRLLALPQTFPGPIVGQFGLLTAVGANLAVKRTAYEKVGGYSDEMRGAAEDCHLTQRLLAAGATYRICDDWVTGHKAENTLRSLWRRFYWYGAGGAQYTLLERDWRMAASHTDASLSGALKAISRKTAAQWRRSADVDQSLIMRLSFAATTALIECAYERGWRHGLRRHGPAHPGGLPEVPPFVEQYVDFADSRARAKAMGETPAD